MSSSPRAEDRRQLFELSWNFAQDSKFAFDAETGILLDANPAAEKLMGHSRKELLGMHVTMLHPEVERERVKVEFRQTAHEHTEHSDYHIQRKDGRCVPVLITSSKSAQVGNRSVLIAAIRDISDQVEREFRLSTLNWALSAYASAALALGQVSSPEDLHQAICEAITRQSAYVLAWVAIAEDGPDKRIQVAAAAGSAVGYLDGLKLSWSKNEPGGVGPTGICIRTNQLQIIEDTETALVFRPWRERLHQFGIRSIVSIPYLIEGSQSGALEVCAAYPNAFEPVAFEVFHNLVKELRHGIRTLDQGRVLQEERRRGEAVQTQLNQALSAMVAPIVTAMEMRDPYTAGHQGRVAEIAYAIGKEMGWPESRLQGLRAAALVHDIGKISIPSEILTKPTKLSSAEREMIKAHVEAGYTILKGIPFAWPIAEIVRQHHEKIDGSGYPRGLQADQILAEAKVLTVADIVEAMAAHRPYRPGMGLKLVLEQIEREAGSLLDAEVVRVCVTLFREKGLLVAGLNSV